MQLKLNQLFNLDHSLKCGQIFRWKQIDDTYYLSDGGIVYELKQGQNTLHVQSSNNATEKQMRHFLGLEDDLTLIYADLSRDENLKKAIEKYPGLRIIKQDPFECLITYICSANSSIPNIESMVTNLAAKYGEPITVNGFQSYTFPTAEQLAAATEEELKECKVGFRAKYIQQTASMIAANQIDLNSFKSMPYFAVKQELMKFPGVGEKVADCVCLFALEKLNAFPVDVWISRTMRQLYGLNTMKDIHDFVSKKWGNNAGYAQEYLFYLFRTL